MFEDELDLDEVLMRERRLEVFRENEGWKQHVRPFLMERYEAAIAAIRYEDESDHWKAVGIEAHIDHLMSFIEGEKWRNHVVVEKEKVKAKESLKEKVVNLFRR